MAPGPPVPLTSLTSWHGRDEGCLVVGAVGGLEGRGRERGGLGRGLGLRVIMVNRWKEAAGALLSLFLLLLPAGLIFVKTNSVM